MEKSIYKYKDADDYDYQLSKFYLGHVIFWLYMISTAMMIVPIGIIFILDLVM
jgi:hypothetical protein